MAEEVDDPLVELQQYSEFWSAMNRSVAWWSAGDLPREEELVVFP